ncbi:site-2 protease family protein [Candidatus Sumerlaeota bacterium]|nr:site-2 protease family protein [Candidatus Sumerlaeota bacterium]
MSTEFLVNGCVWYFVFLFSTVLHEGAHALAGYLMGDSTAYHDGQVSLDPLPHMRREPIGMIVFPLLSFVFYSGSLMLGWASCPYDPEWANHYPYRSALMSLVGPVANLLLVIIAGVAIYIGLHTGYFYPPSHISTNALIGIVLGADGLPLALAKIFSVMYSLNMLLFLFNIIPLPPMDGATAIHLFFKEDAARQLQQVMSIPVVQLFGFMIMFRFFWYLYLPVWRFSIETLYPGLYY